MTFIQLLVLFVVFQICGLYILQRICIYRSKFKGEHGVVFLRGAREFKGCGKGDTSNCHLVFRQEGYFHWYFQPIWSSESISLQLHICFRTFGVVEPNFFGAIDLKTGQSFLYHKEAGAHEALWRGYLPPNQEVGQKLT